MGFLIFIAHHFYILIIKKYEQLFLGYLTWKSNIQTIYGDDDSYFVLLEDRKNGPSPYWVIEPENDFSK